MVCHGGVINGWAGHVLGLGPQMFFNPDYTSINRFRAASSGERSIVSLNETAHLRGRPIFWWADGPRWPLSCGDLGPGQVLVGADVARQAQYSLAEDVLHDLGRAALDRVGPTSQEGLSGAGQPPAVVGCSRS